MKKIRLFLGCLVTMTLLLGACGSANTDGAPTDAPKETEAPIESNTPGSSEITDTPAEGVTPVPVATPAPGKVKAPTDQGDLTYDVGTFTCLSTFASSCEAAEDGGMEVHFEKKWGEVRLALPEAVDLSQCMYIGLTMNTYGNDVSFHFFGEKGLTASTAKAVESQYGCFQNGTTEYRMNPASGKEVYAMSVSSVQEVTDPESYKATVYSVTFYMKSGAKVELPTDVAPDVTEDMTLRSTYGKEFGYAGTAVSLDELQNPAYLEEIKKNYNSVTAGWQMKLDQLLVSSPTLISVEEAKNLGYVIPDNYKESVVPTFRFDDMDAMLKICSENGLKMRFHTLIWHQQALDWFFRTDYNPGAAYVAPEVMDARLELYIRTVMKHVLDGAYGSVVYAWDVVNEYLHFDNVEYENWTAVYGKINEKPSYVKLAFQIADEMLKERGLREEMSLFYNDYNTYMTEWNGRDMTKAIIDLVNYINSDGKICDGVGMQTHMDINENANWREDYKNALQAFSDAGLEIQLTEVDVFASTEAITEQVQEEVYVGLMAEVLKARKAGGKITGITFWGIADSTSNLKEYKPLLFEYPGRPKTAYYRVLQTYLDGGEEKVPTGTKAPAPTEAPKATDTPKPTEAPKPTDTPKATATPKPTATPRPTATPVPTATPKPIKKPNQEGELTFTFDEMECMTEFNGTYELKSDGSVRAQFDAQWAQAIYALPQGVDLTKCEYITVKAKSENYPLGVKLFHKGVFTDVWNSELYCKYDCYGKGTAVYVLSPEMTETVWGVGLMAMEDVQDFSKYTAEAYSITFHMKQEEGATNIKEQTMWGDVTYDFNDLKPVYTDHSSYTVNRDGSVTLSYDERWKDVRFAFPKAVDLNYCMGITVKADATNPMAVKFFDKKFSIDPGCNEIFIDYNYNLEGVNIYSTFPEVLKEVHGIGFMSMEEVNPGDDYKVTVHSITFHMASKADTFVPKQIAPDVTKQMTFKNTYATVFERFGAAVSIQELRHPLVLSEIKEQYTSITLGNDMKPDFLFGWDPKFISVAEAKKQGYIIPANYKEKTVPVLYFDVVDEALRICAENGLELRAHTLLWHEQTQTWFFREGYSYDNGFVTPEVMDARLEYYIRNVMNYVYNHEYGHLIYAWDVVNEYFHSNIDSSDWLHVYGGQGLTPCFVKLAYQVADDVLRDFGIRDQVSLIFNDFNTFEVNSYVNTPEALLSIVKFINSDGKICDGIGMQAHMDVYWPEDQNSIANTAKKFLAAGLEVQITELDITIRNPRYNSEEDQRKLFRKVFTDLLEIKRSGGDISSVTIWGIADNTSWLKEYSPLMFKNYDTPKDAYYEVLQAYLDAGFRMK